MLADDNDLEVRKIDWERILLRSEEIWAEAHSVSGETREILQRSPSPICRAMCSTHHEVRVTANMCILRQWSGKEPLPEHLKIIRAAGYWNWPIWAFPLFLVVIFIGGWIIGDLVVKPWLAG